MPSLYLLDGYSTIFRAFYAIRHLSNRKGEPTNAVFGFHKILQKILREHRPDYFGVALDVSRKTIRSEKYPEYKANRSPMPDDLRPQIPWIRQLLEAYQIPMLEMPNFEADDVIGTLADQAANHGMEVTIVSADKDLFQLVTDGVKLYHTGRDKLYGPAEVREDFGVAPEQVVDVLALMGDASDNIPGVKGIGEKGAKKLILEYGSLRNLLDRSEEISRKSYREGLVDHRDDALLSQDLATIRRNLDIPLKPQDLVLSEPDYRKLREIFSALEFYTLIEELRDRAPAETYPPAERASLEDLDLLRQPQKRRILAMVEADGPQGLVTRAADGRTLYLDFNQDDIARETKSLVANWLEEKTTLVGHDLKELLRLVDRENYGAASLLDLMLLSYVLTPDARSHGLPELALEHLFHRATLATEVNFDQQSLGSESNDLAYAGERLALVEELAQILERRLEDFPHLQKVYQTLEEPLLRVLVDMETTGITLDTSLLEHLSTDLGSRIKKLRSEIHKLAGETFNLNSPKQLGNILFEKLDYPVLKKTRKTKSYATDSDTLQELSNRGYPIPEKILAYRELAKLKSTYVDALPSLVDENGRLHTRFQQAVAATGRLSSTDPNLQNIPTRTEEGRQIRRAFKAPAGFQFVVADYNQIELRILAHIAEEKAMIDAFTSGEDIHRTTAALVFGLAPLMVGAEQRRAAKTINFGIIYGISPYGLGRNLGVKPREAKAFIETYLAQYPGVSRYMEETVEEATERGFVTTLFGRIRHLPDLKARNFQRREAARRMAINARIQGTAADILKLAMIAVDTKLRRDHPEARLLLTVHDELVLECPTPQVDAVSESLKTAMKEVASLRIPLVVDVGTGPTWFDAKA